MLTSLQIAQTTGKDHFNVLRDIREEIANLEMVLVKPTEPTKTITTDEGSASSKLNTLKIDEEKFYEACGCEAKLTKYKDELGRLQPMYELNDLFAACLVATYGVKGRKGLVRFMHEKTKSLQEALTKSEKLAQHRLEKLAITDKAFNELYEEGVRIARNVQSYKCDIAGENQFHERQRAIAKAGGIEKIKYDRLKAIVDAEMDAVNHAEAYFAVQHKAQIECLQHVKASLKDSHDAQIVKESLRLLNEKAEQRAIRLQHEPYVDWARINH